MRVVEVDPVWERRVWEFLRARRERRPRQPDPLYEKPPRGDWRETLRWIWRVATWPWWDPPAPPGRTWQLAGVTLWKFDAGFEPGPALTRED